MGGETERQEALRRMTAADRRKLNKDAGFSLLELLIAVIILAIIVIPLMNLFLTSNRLNIKSRQTLRATTAAQDIMEGLKAYNIEELKAQFADPPESDFYVIDSRLIKNGVKEETALEVDGSGNPAPGLYVFSMRELTLQGSKFDAKIVVDGRGYMKGTLTHDEAFNDAALSDARSIDKNNGTFVETYKIRKAVLAGIFKDSDVENAVKARLTAAGFSDVDDEFLKLKSNATFKNITTDFDKVERTIEVELTEDPADLDENGNPRVFMKVTQTYNFTFTYTNAAGASVTKTLSVKGDASSSVGEVDNKPCGKITATKDGSLNVNLFYYPLYGPTGKIGNDEIIIKNGSGADLNLLIAKQQCDIGDPEYLTDQQLMQEEERYHANVTINGAAGLMTAAHFTLKTNLGMNLAGMAFLKTQGRTSEYVNNQFVLNTTPMVAATPPAAGSTYNIFTLDGVPSPMGNGTAAATGGVTELIYDVRVSIYKEGAADANFPDEDRMVEITGSMTN